MMDSRIAMLMELLDTRRGELAVALQDTPPQLRDTVPSAGAWSVAMVLEHLAQTETAVTGLLTGFVGAAEARPEDEAFDRNAFAAHLDMPAFLDRTRKLRLSQPSGSVSAADAWAMLTATRSQLLAVLQTSEGLRLEGLSRPHPAGRELDGYQWIAFVGLHEARHADQLREINAQLPHAELGNKSEAAETRPSS